ncbi:MAG TPA: thioredoxin domain-containing protein [Magnetospirillaceae bacterium]|nr:thioredoxin domain-containing protein [Magnetospirillaceae bacterium]
MDKLKWIIFTVIVLGIFGGIIWLGKSDDAGTFNGDANKIITAGPIADHVFGTDAQKVTLIEYGDFQCPACYKMYPSVHDLTTKYPDKLTFIFRNKPLTQLHPNALAAATAAEAAGLQGKYFDMYDMLYQTQPSWQGVSVGDRTTLFQNYAQQLGLDVEKFKTDLSSKDISDKINRDKATANVFKVEGTPTFVINGQRVDGAIATDPDKFTAFVEAEIAKAYPPTE